MVLSSLGMKLSTSKTKLQVDPILASIKPDKIEELFIPEKEISLSKKLVRIYTASTKHPNSGMITRQLRQFFTAVNKVERLEAYDDPEVMISVALNIALKSPKSYQWSMAIISNLLAFLPHKIQVDLIKAIKTKFDIVPNTGLLDIWLQRVSHKIDRKIIYKEALTTLMGHRTYPGNIFWNSSWLNTELQDIMDTSIIDKAAVRVMPKTITMSEVDLFVQNQHSL